MITPPPPFKKKNTTLRITSRYTVSEKKINVWGEWLHCHFSPPGWALGFQSNEGNSVRGTQLHTVVFQGPRSLFMRTKATP